MSLRFNAYTAVDYIKENFVDFLLDWRYSSNPEIRDLLRRRWMEPEPKNGGVVSRPLLESVFSFESSGRSLDVLSGSIKELHGLNEHIHFLAHAGDKIKAGDLSPLKDMFGGKIDLQETFAQLLQKESFPPDRQLYAHQETAINASFSNKNVIVSAGTGSGKSECFLFPTFARLLAESDAELQQPGIRVLIVYPLNALINSQMRRLQAWLGLQESSSKIRFGFFTSKLKDKKNKQKVYEQNNQNVPERFWPDNQIMCRKELRDNPPHILVTNYSMLEYMHLRKRDNRLFDGGKLHTIILDEAHTYSGALAAELAMLLRRTLIRFGKTSDEINFFATSATIGDPEQDEGRALREFCAQIFNQSTSSFDVILGKRILPLLPTAQAKVTLQQIKTLLEDDGFEQDVLRVQSTVPGSSEYNTVIQSLKSKLITLGYKNDSSSAAIHDILYNILSPVKEVLKLRGEMLAKQKYLHEIAAELFPGENPKHAEKLTGRLLYYASLAKTVSMQLPLIPVKLHLVAGGPEGIFVCRDENCSGKTHSLPFGAVLNTRVHTCPHCGGNEIAEIVVCRHCGETYLVSEKDPDGVLHLPKWSRDMQAEGLSLVSLESGTDVSLAACNSCNRKKDRTIIDIDGETTEEEAEEKKQDELLSYMDFFFVPMRLGHFLLQYPLIDYLFECLDPVPDGDHLPGEGRKLLIFTDNRQKAAALAARLEWNRGFILGRRIIYDAVNKSDIRDTVRQALKPVFDFAQSSPPDLVDAVIEVLSNKSRIPQTTEDWMEFLRPWEGFQELAGNFKIAISRIETTDTGVPFQTVRDRLERKAMGPLFPFLNEKLDSYHFDKEQQQKMLAGLVLTQNICRLPFYATNIETLGLVSTEYSSLLTHCHEAYGLSQVAVHALSMLCLDRMRNYGAFSIKHIPDVPYYVLQYILGEKYQYGRRIALERDSELDKDEYLEYFRPADTAKRSNLFMRLIRKALIAVNEDTMSESELSNTSMDILYHIWNNAVERSNLFNNEYIGTRRVYSLDPLKFILRPDPQLYRCESCGLVSTRDTAPLGSICIDIECKGKMRPFTANEQEEWKQKNAFKHTMNMPPIGMSTSEHTAQLDSSQLEENEKDFIDGKINVLSSSTTMELGIDIGGLSAVHLSNCPPGSANYLQRAGRAGRRMDGTSIVMTNARMLPYDRLILNNPRYFFEVPPPNPYISMESRKIILRHINAYLLSWFFIHFLNLSSRSNPIEAYGSVGDFFINMQPFEDGEKSSAVYCADWLDQMTPDDINEEEYSSLVRDTVLEHLPVQEASALLSAEIRKAADEIVDEIARHNDNIRKASADGDTPRKTSIEISKDFILKTNLIEFFASRTILPKYGFPIDVIKLQTRNKETKPKKGMKKNAVAQPRLERNLAMALAEYSPGNSVIVNKRKVVSAGIAFSTWDVEWKPKEGQQILRYVICNKCGAFEKIKNESKYQGCRVCGHSGSTGTDYFDEPKTDIKPNILKQMLRPMGFTVDYSEPQPYAKALEILPARPSMRAGVQSGDEEFLTLYEGGLQSRHTSNGSIIALHEGAYGAGYDLCLTCGRTESSNSHDQHVSNIKKAHTALRPLWDANSNSWNKRCPAESVKERIAFFGEQITDILQIRLDGDFYPGFEDEVNQRFFETLGKAMLLAGAEMLEIDSREINYLINPYRNTESPEQDTRQEIILYDSVSGGAGYCEELGKQLSRLLENALEKLHCPADCDAACPSCIYTYEFVVDEEPYDRHLVLNFFDAPERSAVLRGETEQIRKNYTEGPYRLHFDVPAALRKLLSTNEQYESIVWYFQKYNPDDFSPYGFFPRIIDHIKQGAKCTIVFGEPFDADTQQLITRKLQVLLSDYGDKLKIREAEEQDETVAYLGVRGGTALRLVNYKNASVSFLESALDDPAPLLEYTVDSVPVVRAGDITDKIRNADMSSFRYRRIERGQDGSLSAIIRETAAIGGKKITSICYSDRYITSHGHLASLYSLLYGLELNENCAFRLATQPVHLYGGQDLGAYNQESDRLKDLKALRETLKEKGLSRVEIYTTRRKSHEIPGGQHRRELELHFESGDPVRIILDPGIDIYKPVLPGHTPFLPFSRITRFEFRQGDVYCVPVSGVSMEERMRHAERQGLLNRSVVV